MKKQLLKEEDISMAGYRRGRINEEMVRELSSIIREVKENPNEISSSKNRRKDLGKH